MSDIVCECNICKKIFQIYSHNYEKEESTNQILTFNDALKHFSYKKIPFQKANMRLLNIINEKDNYTNLGLLLSDQCPNKIKLAVFEGVDKNIFHDRKEFSGSILKQLEEALEFTEKYNRTRAEIKGIYRVDTRDYDIVAVREAIINSVVHKDYAINSPILISIFDDRIEIVNVGGLVSGISYDDIMMGVSSTRNEWLANIFYRLELIEAYGTGISKIQGSYTNAIVKPVFEVTDNAFKVVLPNLNSKANRVEVKENVSYYYDSREEQIVNLCLKQSSINRKDVENLLGVSQATAGLIIKRMVEKNILRKDNNGKYQRYILVNK